MENATLAGQHAYERRAWRDAYDVFRRRVRPGRSRLTALRAD